MITNTNFVVKTENAWNYKMIISIPLSLYIIISLFISFVLYILKNPEVVDKWSYLYNKYLAFRTEKREKNIVSKNVDYKITAITKRINKESDGIIPFGLRIKWCDISKVDSYIQKSDVIVVLKKEDNCDKNIIDICRAFVPKATLPKSRNCVEKKVLEAVDTFMIKSILNNGDYSSAYNYYLNNYYNPTLQNDKLLEKYLTIINDINNIGFFTRILLAEYRRVGNKLYGTNEEEAFHEESIDFFKFLECLSKRKPGDNTPLIFLGNRIKIGLIYVAKRMTYNAFGSESYVKRVEKDIDQGAQRIFILSYSQFYDMTIEDGSGYVLWTKHKKEFIILNSVEKKLKANNKLKLIHKQKYKTFDVTGHKRYAKYLVYEVIR